MHSGGARPFAAVPSGYITAPRLVKVATPSEKGAAAGPTVSVPRGRGTFAMGGSISLSVSTKGARPAVTPSAKRSPLGRYAGLAGAPLLSPANATGNTNLFSCTLKGFAQSDVVRLEERRDEIVRKLAASGVALPLAADVRTSRSSKAPAKRKKPSAAARKAAALAMRTSLLPRQALPEVAVRPKCAFASQFRVTASKTSEAKPLWGNLLAEMKWWAADFRGERKRKRKMEKTFARGVTAHHKALKLQRQRRLKKRLQLRKQTARSISKSVLSFWGKVDQILMYKHRERLEVRKQQSMERRLRYLVKQTETLSSSIVTKMLDSRRGAEADGAAAAAAERAAQSDAAVGAAAFAGKRVSYCVAGGGAEDGEEDATVVGGVIRQKQKRRFMWEGDRRGLGSVALDTAPSGGAARRAHRTRPRATILQVILDTGEVRPFLPGMFPSATVWAEGAARPRPAAFFATSDDIAMLSDASDLTDEGKASLSFMYRYISRETCSQFDSLPLTSLTMKAPPTTATSSIPAKWTTRPPWRKRSSRRRRARTAAPRPRRKSSRSLRPPR